MNHEGPLWKMRFLGVNGRRSGPGTPLPLCRSKLKERVLARLKFSGHHSGGAGRLGRPHMCRGAQRGVTMKLYSGLREGAGGGSVPAALALRPRC